MIFAMYFNIYHDLNLIEYFLSLVYYFIYLFLTTFSLMESQGGRCWSLISAVPLNQVASVPQQCSFYRRPQESSFV